MNATENLDVIVTDVLNCARCKDDHEKLEFHRFTHPIVDTDNTVWNFWAACPGCGQPILLRVEEEHQIGKS